MDLPTTLYEDDALIAFDKPSGLLVAPDRWDKGLVNLMGLIHEQLSPTIFNVHRLDKDTSGIVLCAKTKPALDVLTGQFQSRTAKKRYVALIRGNPAWTELRVDAALAPDVNVPGRTHVAKHGKAAVTLFRVLTTWRGWTLIEALPETGRTHQIRVHAQHAGIPIVGDPFYSDGQGLFLSSIKRKYKPKRDQPERPLLGRLALHAQSLTVVHPHLQTPLTIESPLPDDFEVALKYLRKFAGM